MAENLSSGLNHFTLKLFNKLSSGKNENFFISPFSISTALSMCYAGAKSETAEQLKDLLSLNDFEKDDELFEATKNNLNKLNTALENVSLNTANRVYPRIGFNLNQSYADIIKNNFLSEIEQLDFNNNQESANTINKWVSDQTKDKIKDLISPSVITADTEMILVNAIYFKGDWLHQFKATQTTKEDFHLADGTTKQCDMMKLFGKRFQMLHEPFGLSAKTCTLAYMGNQVSMTIILPNEGVKLDEVENQLKNLRLHNGLDHLARALANESQSERVNVHLPRFKLEYKDELTSHFKELGASTPFDRNSADFTGINNDAKTKGLHISKVIHQAVVEVNEEGTVAAAATGVVMMTRCLVVEDPLEFICNRPFLFLLHENIDNTILFFGKFVNPE